MNLQNLLSNTSSDRNNLKPNFNTGEIPTQTDFHTLIDGLFRLRDDSIYKDADNGLCIKAGTDADTTALLLYDDFNDPKWSISIKDGFHIKDASNNKRLTIRGNRVGIGTTDPKTNLELNGHFFIRDGNNAAVINFPSTGTYPNLYIRSGAPGSTGIKDRFFISGGNGNVGIGTTSPHQKARLQVRGGAIMPAEGNSESSGILFPPDAFGGAGDRGYIRYYARSGESTTLEIGNKNDSTDHIALMPSGNVGIGTIEPRKKLHIEGDIYFSNNAIISHIDPNNPTTNIDHIWHNDSGLGVWHFVSDESYKANGNSRLQAGSVNLTSGGQSNIFAGHIEVRKEIITRFTASNARAFQVLDNLNNNQLLIGGAWDNGVYFYWKNNSGQKRRAIISGQAFSG